MKIVMDGDAVITLEDKSYRGGYRVLEDDNFFNPSDGVTVFIENPQAGARPWIAYVRRNEDGEFDFSNATRMPLDKSRITRVM